VNAKLNPAVGFVLPPDLYWLLRLDVKPGGATPFHCWMWWHWQWLVPRGGPA
jgi:hypothetical protein